MEFNGKIKTEKIVLERLRLAAGGFVSPEVLDSISVEALSDFLISDMVKLVATMNLPAERLPEQELDASMSVPASWWQMLKRDAMPSWFTGRWPVRTEREWRRLRVVPKAVYPQLPLRWPEAARNMSLHYFDAEEVEGPGEKLSPGLADMPPEALTYQRDKKRRMRHEKATGNRNRPAAGAGRLRDHE